MEQNALHQEIGRRNAGFCKSAMMLVHKWMRLGLGSRPSVFTGLGVAEEVISPLPSACQNDTCFGARGTLGIVKK